MESNKQTNSWVLIRLSYVSWTRFPSLWRFCFAKMQPKWQTTTCLYNTIPEPYPTPFFPPVYFKTGRSYLPCPLKEGIDISGITFKNLSLKKFTFGKISKGCGYMYIFFFQIPQYQLIRIVRFCYHKSPVTCCGKLGIEFVSISRASMKMWRFEMFL